MALYDYRCFYKCRDCSELSFVDGGFHFDASYKCPHCSSSNTEFTKRECLNAPTVMYRANAGIRKDIQNLQDRVSSQREMGKRLGLYNGK